MYVDVTLDDIILYALEHHVSDIHFDPTKKWCTYQITARWIIKDAYDYIKRRGRTYY